MKGTSRLTLDDASRVAVRGGGPAGSSFRYFLSDSTARLRLDLDVDLHELQDFFRPGGRGCNMRGAVSSESLVQTLAAEGMRLSSSEA